MRAVQKQQMSRRRAKRFAEQGESLEVTGVNGKQKLLIKEEKN